MKQILGEQSARFIKVLPEIREMALDRWRLGAYWLVVAVESESESDSSGHLFRQSSPI